jgi:hypothetical protein
MSGSETKEKLKEYIPAVVVEWLDYYAMWAAESPKDFLISVFAILLPFFLISACLAYQMVKDIDRKRVIEGKKAKRMEKVKQKTKTPKRNKITDSRTE